MSDQKSPYCGCLYYTSNALSRLMTKMADEAFSKTGLTSSYAFLLMSTLKKPGIQPKELSEIMQLTPSTLTRLIEKMEFKGLLYREIEGRCTLVYPTKEGEALETKLKEAWTGLFNKYSELIGKENSVKLTQDIYEASLKLNAEPSKANQLSTKTIKQK